MKSKLNIDYNMINTVLMVIILIIVVYCCVKKQNENFSEPCILYQMDENGKCAILGDNESYTGPMRCGSCPGQLGMKEAGGANWSEDLATLSEDKSKEEMELTMIVSGLLVLFMQSANNDSWIDKNFSDDKPRSTKQKNDVVRAINYLNLINLNGNNSRTALSQAEGGEGETRAGETYKKKCAKDSTKDVCLLDTSIDGNRKKHLAALNTWVTSLENTTDKKYFVDKNDKKDYNETLINELFLSEIEKNTTKPE